MLHCLPYVVSTITRYPMWSLPTQLVEAIVLPMTHKERFENIGIQPPKGRLLCMYIVISEPSIALSSYCTKGIVP